MNPLEYIAQEKQRVQSRIEKIAPELGRLNTELDQLESAEQVLARHAEANPSVADTGTKRRGRPPAAGRSPKPSDGRPSLSDAILGVVAAHPAGANKDSITAGLLANGIEARANHIGIALKRHERGDRLVKRDGLWFVPEGGGAERGEEEPAEMADAAE
jgi:hypothetical protein